MKFYKAFGSIAYILSLLLAQ